MSTCGNTGGKVTDLEDWVAHVRTWLRRHLSPRPDDEDLWTWGRGPDDFSVFRDLDPEEERALLERAMAWQQTKFDAGYGAITWDPAYGGTGLTEEHEAAFRREERVFEKPEDHETLTVTVHLMAPTVHMWGDTGQRERFVQSFLRAEELCCQLFSEPRAGSDLANVGTRATRQGEEWVLEGQKVWSSGAQFSQWGLALCRTNPKIPKHQGVTMFLVPMDAPGVEVRPIRQITGGSSFSEVFLSGVRIPDELRLGEIGAGWRIALTTLGFERNSSGAGALQVGGSWSQVAALARWTGQREDPVVRQQLARIYTNHRIQELLHDRTLAQRATKQPPGPEGSIGKLLWSQGMTSISDLVSELLGPRLIADTGEQGTFAWSQHVLGAPGYRIAGGTDEIQRNIIAERVLGLPPDVRLDKDVPYTDLPG